MASHVFRCALLFGCLGLLPSIVCAENWPGFRGPTGMGISQETELPLTWNASDGGNVIWKVALPATTLEAKADHNQSSPIVWQDRVFVTTAFWPADRKQEEQPEQRLTCYRLADGEQLWDTPSRMGTLARRVEDGRRARVPILR